MTAKLLAAYDIRTKMMSYNDHSDAFDREKILTLLEGGKAIGLVSDAGTPLLNDPGYKLVRAALERGVPITALPGPSAILNALVLSGLSPDSFSFVGFLPAKPAERRAVLRQYINHPLTIILFETGKRLHACLHDMQDILGDRSIAITREMTKLHEEIIRGNLADLDIDQLDTRGEFVLVINGQKEHIQLTDEQIFDILTNLLKDKPLKTAAKIVAASYGCSRQHVYELGLRLKNKK